MTIVYVLCGLSLFLSASNLLATLFLSNSLFRLLVRRTEAPTVDAPAGGLVELRETPTYDPRFRR